MLVDSHCHLEHLNLETYGGKVSGAIKAAEENHVGCILNVAVELSEMSAILHTAHQFPQVFASIGTHPLNLPDTQPDTQALIEMALHEPKIVAVGETGLDYHRGESNIEQQHAHFIAQLQAAKQLQLPVIVHTRDAQKDTMDILRAHACTESVGVLHCFTENWEMAQQALDLGFYISISGIVTFRNAQEIRDIAQKIPEDRLLIETDAPYLAPVPYRGKSNEPAYVAQVAQCIAEVRNQSVEHIARTTTDNFFRLFTKVPPIQSDTAAFC